MVIRRFRAGVFMSSYEPTRGRCLACGRSLDEGCRVLGAPFVLEPDPAESAAAATPSGWLRPLLRAHPYGIEVECLEWPEILSAYADWLAAHARDAA